MEESLRRDTHRLRDIAEAAFDWFWESDPTHRCTYLYQRPTSTSRVRWHTVIGKARQEIVTPEDMTDAPEKWVRFQHILDAREPFRNFVYRAIGTDGTMRYVQTSGIPVFGAHGEFLGYRGGGTDITDKKQEEDALRTAKIEAEMATRSKSEFLAKLSHELREPLNAIIGFSDSIQQEVHGPVGNEKYTDYIRDIHDSGLHLLDLINDILDVATVESGKLELREDIVNLAEIAAASLRLIEPRAEKARVRLSVIIDDGMPDMRADERRLKQILLNLLSNAVKFTPPSGNVCLKGMVQEDGYLALTVTDTGIGMDEDGMVKAMSPFSQIESDHTAQHEGNGLGLPLTKGLVEAHGGTLAIESIPNAGTSVTVRFPPARITAHRPQKDAKRP